MLPVGFSWERLINEHFFAVQKRKYDLKADTIIKPMLGYAQDELLASQRLEHLDLAWL